MRPPYLFHSPCRWVDFRLWKGPRRKRQDGDTVGITMISGLLWKVRIKNLLAPENGTPEGRAATHFAESVLEEAAHELSAEFELPDNIREIVLAAQPINLLDHVSFNRVVGDIWIGETDRFSEIMVNSHHAVWEKKG